MQQLVFIENDRPVTDSLKVAVTFGKEHRRVMQDIRDLGCSEEFRVHHFVQSEYSNNQGRKMPQVIMTEQGFTLLVMGYTGKKAMEFKERYIQQFHQMREKLQQNVVPLNDRQAMIQSLKLTAELAEEQEQIKEITQQHSQKILELDTKIEEQITLDHGEQRKLQKVVARKVYDTTSDPAERRRLFRELYREIKDRFGVASYKDVKRKELSSAINYVTNWIPRKVS